MRQEAADSVPANTPDLSPAPARSTFPPPDQPAADGREALARLRAEELPSLILLDLLMPRMDGWQFREAQLQDPSLRAIPTIVITAISRDYLKAGYLPGVVVLPKPFDVHQLLA